MTFGRQAATVSLGALPSNLARPILMHVLAGTIDGRPVQITVPPRLVEMTAASVLPGVDIARLSPATRALAIDAGLSSALDALELHLGASVVIERVVDGRDTSFQMLRPNLAIRLALDGNPALLLAAHVPIPIAHRLLALQAGHGAGDKPAAVDPEIPLAVRVGSTLSTASEIASLGENDTLLLDETLLDDNRLCLIADEQLATLGVLDGRTLMLDGALAPIEDGWLRKFVATPPVGSRRAAGATNGAEVPVVVVADLAYRMARVSELLKIEVQAPVPLPHGIDGIVELRINRRRLATGRLARVGRSVGVRILRIDEDARS